MKSAAEAYEDRAIAIVFSGAGSDGLAGARSIKERGGTVIVQDPATAVHPSMPRSIPPNLTDLSAAPQEIGKLVGELTRDSIASASPDEQKSIQTLLLQLRAHRHRLLAIQNTDDHAPPHAANDRGRETLDQ